MSNVFVTGSSDGIGRMTAELLHEGGHDVVFHARNSSRADDIRRHFDWAEKVVIGDLSTIAGARSVAERANQHGRFDAVIHNAGIYRSRGRGLTEDGLPDTFVVNTLSPYILTSLIERPRRIIYTGSSMHHGVKARLDDVEWSRREWEASEAYSESKLYVLQFSETVARFWRDVNSNAVDPGWVATKMGGPGAADDIDEAHRTQVWLATSDEPTALVTGKYFHHMRQIEPDPAVHDADDQARLVAVCAQISGVSFPRG